MSGMIRAIKKKHGEVLKWVLLSVVFNRSTEYADRFLTKRRGKTVLLSRGRPAVHFEN